MPYAAVLFCIPEPWKQPGKEVKKKKTFEGIGTCCMVARLAGENGSLRMEPKEPSRKTRKQIQVQVTGTRMAKAILEKSKSTVKNERDQEEVATMKDFMKKEVQFLVRRGEENIKHFESRRKKKKKTNSKQTGHRIEIFQAYWGLFMSTSAEQTNGFQSYVASW
jgi:ribosomal protein S12